MAKGLLTFAALFTAIVATIPLQVVAYLWPEVWLWAGLPVSKAAKRRFGDAGVA